MDLSNLEFNKIYLIHEQYYEVFNKDYIDSLFPMIFTHQTHRLDEGIICHFDCPLTEVHTSLSEFSINNSVFESKAAFLKYSFKYAELNKIKMDDYFLNAVTASQEKYPELWI